MSRQPDLLKSLGPCGIGYAWIRDAASPRAGICVRHRPDGTPRLVFDLTINYHRQNPQHDLPHGRRLGVEFVLRYPKLLPPDVAVLIGQRSWRDLADRFQPAGSNPWHTWPKECSTTSVWRGETVSLMPWSVELRWPVSRVDGAKPPPCAGILARELALWHGEEDICAVDSGWLKELGTLIIDGQTTCFFPNHVP